MRHFTRIGALLALASISASCGDVVRQGKSPVYVVIDQLLAIQGQFATGSSGATGGTSNLLSDVIGSRTSPAPCSTTDPCPTVFNDLGTVTFRLSLKDIGTPTSPTTATNNNEVTINRYNVRYRRADGRNVQGVDVPYAFEGAITVTIPKNGTATSGFELVRHVAKNEAPLVQLRYNTSIITTIADVTFYGRDQVGNEVVVTGSIQIDFGNFGD